MNWGGPGYLVVNLIANYCWTRVLLYAKMLKKTETEETIGIFLNFYYGSILIGGGPGPLPPPSWLRLRFRCCNNDLKIRTTRLARLMISNAIYFEFFGEPNKVLNEATSEPVNNNKNICKLVKIMPPTGCFAVRRFRGVTTNFIQIHSIWIRFVIPLKSLTVKQPVGALF